MFWRLADRRRLREERDAEDRLRGLIEKDGRRDVYVPGSVYSVLGHHRGVVHLPGVWGGADPEAAVKKMSKRELG
jgi:hypothetical protein